MKCSVLVMAAALCAGTAAAQYQTQTQTNQKPAQAQKQAINATCPVSGNPIDAAAGTVEYGGHAIGFCCPGCVAGFQGWDEAKKNEFVRVSLASQTNQPEGDDHQEGEGAGEIGTTSGPYTLLTCPVSGEQLGSMGDPIVKTYDGREVKFCCEGCVDTFEKDKAKYWAQIDEAMIAQQLPHYPLTTCAVRGSALGSMGEPVNMIHNNRLVRFCCSGCVKTFQSDPDKYFAQMDKQIIAQQAPHYPLVDCPVGGHAHNGAYDVIYMNRLVRLCCEGCEWKLFDKPTEYLPMLDKAYADAQRASYPLATCIVTGEALDNDAIEIVAGTQLVRLCCKGCVKDFNQSPQKFLDKIAAAKGEHPGASNNGG
ncbi:MAG: hypothetical protein ACF8R7_09915 [Phycisphaerales bacterium JB039]